MKYVEYNDIEPDWQTTLKISKPSKSQLGYYKLARHYKFALTSAFSSQPDGVIIVEDDLQVSPDFFNYMISGYEIYKQNPEKVFCVSAWNDNGLPGQVDVSRILDSYYTDFFPGLGWLLPLSVWKDWEQKWPNAYWDDWVREPEQRKERICIHPEVPRSHTFGKIGVSNGQFYEKHLKKMVLNDEYFTLDNWRESMQHLVDVENYRREKFLEISKLENWDTSKADLCFREAGEFKAVYKSEKQFAAMAEVFGIMKDFKAGIPRMGFDGNVEFVFRRCRLFLTAAK